VETGVPGVKPPGRRRQLVGAAEIASVAPSSLSQKLGSSASSRSRGFGTSTSRTISFSVFTAPGEEILANLLW